LQNVLYIQAYAKKDNLALAAQICQQVDDYTLSSPTDSIEKYERKKVLILPYAKVLLKYKYKYLFSLVTQNRL
jgi:hypothetical protein